MPILDKLKDKLSKSISKTPVLKVTMMGPRAVGKTTLMASIFSESRDCIAGSNVYFRPEAKTASDLIQKKLLLQNIIAKQKDFNDTPSTGAIAATSTETTFSFEMGKVGRAKTVDIEIKDFPGEYLISNPSKVSDYVKESDVIMIAIDSPYLMEENGRFNEDRNETSKVVSYFKNNESFVKDKMVLLVPLKCERYFHDYRIGELNQKVKEAYKPLIAFSESSNITIIITPIQTLGSVEFDHFEDNPMGVGSSKISHFRYYGNKPKFLPMFCVQPLYYVLTYVTNEYEWLQKQPVGYLERIKNTFISYLKNDDEFFHEIKKIGKNILYNENGYEVVLTNTIFKLK